MDVSHAPARTTLRILAVVAVAAVAALAAFLLLGGGAEPRPSPLVPAPRAEAAEDPFAYDPDRAGEFTERAATGLSHVLYAKSPGGVVASAERVTSGQGDTLPAP